jgi:hypothetical protein
VEVPARQPSIRAARRPLGRLGDWRPGRRLVPAAEQLSGSQTASRLQYSALTLQLRDDAELALEHRSLMVPRTR